MPSCNNNSNITRIYVSQPCDPCNPCTSCHRCACDCACESPTYETTGCISIVPSDCVKYVGDPLPDQGILTNDTLTVVIEKLSTSIVAPAPSMMMAKAFAPEEAPVEETDLEKLEKKVTALAKKVTKNGSIADLKLVETDIIKGTVENKQIQIDLDIDYLIERLFVAIRESSVNTVRFAKLLDFMSDTSNFVLHPYNITVIPQGSGLIVKWEPVVNANTYSVFYKTISENTYTESGSTPAAGITLLNLEADTEYAVYVVANSDGGKQSAPSPITIVKTN